jgi:hypothetical protein
LILLSFESCAYWFQPLSLKCDITWFRISLSNASTCGCYGEVVERAGRECVETLRGAADEWAGAAAAAAARLEVLDVAEAARVAARRVGAAASSYRDALVSLYRRP